MNSTSNSSDEACGCPSKKAINKLTTESSCPVPHLPYNPQTNDFNYDQSEHSSQREVLSKTRAVSTIPKVDHELIPQHQPKGVDRWVYPSEQQYFNAMKRKGYNPSESDVPVILAIHNMVNEQGWSKVKEWESFRGNSFPKLLRFTGRPNDLSPKALILSLIGYSLPFDRHDWIVERNGKEVRYVIDFYRGRRHDPNSAIAIHLDVRPALDTPAALVDRVSSFFRRRFWPSSLPVSSIDGLMKSEILKSHRQTDY